jgi:hypothetical protein
MPLAYEDGNDVWVEYSAGICRDVEDVIRAGQTCLVPCSDMGHMIAVIFADDSVNIVQVRVENDSVYARTISIPDEIRDAFPDLTFRSTKVDTLHQINTDELFWSDRAEERAANRTTAQVSFAMGMHPRVGDGSVVKMLDDEMLKLILDLFIE